MKKNIFFVNAHPDDLNAAMGTAIRLRDCGNCVLHVVDVTHGERGLSGRGISETECAALREQEECEVCARFGTEPVWLQEHDGTAFASEASCRQLAALFQAKPPAAVFTQWPLDRHVDHVMCAAIAMNALRIASGNAAGQMREQDMTELYFYHYVSNSLAGHPTHYVPLSEEEMQEKMEIISLYRCQDGPFMAEAEKRTNRFYGERIRKPYAEAFTAFQPNMLADSFLNREGFCCNGNTEKISVFKS